MFGAMKLAMGSAAEAKVPIAANGGSKLELRVMAFVNGEEVKAPELGRDAEQAEQSKP